MRSLYWFIYAITTGSENTAGLYLIYEWTLDFRNRIKVEKSKQNHIRLIY